jgi:F-type H+-transporting ATPase subunit gamma
MYESITSEHAARMTAMENATRNADEVVRKLTLLFNKTRQAQITKELMDIVNGTEALSKGGSE